MPKLLKRSQRGQTTEDERTTVCCRGTSCWNCIRKLILADSIMSLWVDFAEGLWFSRHPGWYAPYKTVKLRLRKPYPRLAHWIASYPQASWWWNAHAAPRVWFHLALNLCLHSSRMPLFIKRTWHQFWGPWISQILRAPQKKQQETNRWTRHSTFSFSVALRCHNRQSAPWSSMWMGTFRQRSKSMLGWQRPNSEFFLPGFPETVHLSIFGSMARYKSIGFSNHVRKTSRLGNICRSAATSCTLAQYASLKQFQIHKKSTQPPPGCPVCKTIAGQETESGFGNALVPLSPLALFAMATCSQLSKLEP